MTTDGRGPRVSVIMPVFDAGPFVTEALDSVAAQTYRDFEVVIVDDGSTESRTLAALDRVRSRPGVTVLRTENHGPAAARNLAIERARGSYVLPLDADDYLAPAFLARTVPVLDADPGVGVVYTWVGLVGSHLLGERLGRNQQFKSIGSLAAAGLFGFLGYFCRVAISYLQLPLWCFRP